MVQNCSIWHQWSGGDGVLVHGRDNAAPGERRGRGSALGHDMPRPAGPMEAKPTTKGTWHCGARRLGGLPICSSRLPRPD